jgi:hypothetical protein
LRHLDCVVFDAHDPDVRGLPLPAKRRIEAEQAYWFRKKKSMTPEDDAAFREFTPITRAYLSPASIAEAVQDTIDHIEGRSPGRYWDTRPGEEIPKLPPMDDSQRAGLDYARRVFGIGGHQGGGNR